MQGEKWKDVQGRTVFRATFATGGELLRTPMTTVVFTAERMEGNRAIETGDIFKECYFDTLQSAAPANDDTVRVVLGIRCKDHLFRVNTVAVPPTKDPPPR